MNSLLLEVGTEEIPAGYIEPALNALSSTLCKKLADSRIGFGASRIMGTPRRLAVLVADVAAKQESLTTEVLGPPKNVGLDEKGRPTVAAEKFAEKIGVSVKRLFVKETEKGAYLCGKKTERGVSTKTILKSVLPDVILATPFPKTMKWADLNIYFARPIHTVTALLGESLISFTLGNVKSSRFSLGHRFMHPKKVKITGSDAYADLLRPAYVMVDLEERRNMVEKAVSEAAASLGGKVLPDEELIDIVKNLVEYPYVVAGKFDDRFLALPDEVLINSMREHQKYFAVIDGAGKLMPCFITVSNTKTKDMDLVARGNERVLRARLSDAEFFYNADLETAMDDWVEKLKGVLFQAKLGSMYEKTVRVRAVAEYIADAAGGEEDLKKNAARAAWLCKADLVSQVVVEFPKLQGVMGRVYAGKAGEKQETARAIEEHYRPVHSGAALPETPAGAVLSVADKIDSICGCFSAGLIPTGASDPYALRRQGFGVIQIMRDKGFSFPLSDLIRKSADMFQEKSETSPAETADAVYAFLRNRISHLLSEEGFSKDVIAAVADVSVDHIPEVWQRVRALETLKSEPDFEPLAAAFKRVVNIIRQAGEMSGEAALVQESLFEHDSEKALYDAFRSVKSNVDDHLRGGAFDRALREIATLRGPVDAFFDGVLVMTDDLKVRNNRFALLKQIADMFAGIADFSKIST